jgi:hypothetical protein
MSPKVEKRIVKLLEQNVHIQDILKIEGLDPGNERKTIRKLAAQHNLSVVEGPRGIAPHAQVPFLRRGNLLRVEQLVKALVTAEGREDVCGIIGLTQREQMKAESGVHDWNLSQLSRLAEAFRVPLYDLLFMMYGTDNPAYHSDFCTKLIEQYHKRKVA